MNICVSMCYMGNREAVVTGDDTLINGTTMSSALLERCTGMYVYNMEHINTGENMVTSIQTSILEYPINPPNLLLHHILR